MLLLYIYQTFLGNWKHSYNSLYIPYLHRHPFCHNNTGSSDLLENITNDLSRNVFPLRERCLSNHNWLALTGLLNGLHFISHYVEKVKGSQYQPVPEQVLAISETKEMKLRYKKAVLQFNEKQSEGIKYLQDNKLLQVWFILR